MPVPPLASRWAAILAVEVARLATPLLVVERVSRLAPVAADVWQGPAVTGVVIRESTMPLVRFVVVLLPRLPYAIRLPVGIYLAIAKFLPDSDDRVS